MIGELENIKKLILDKNVSLAKREICNKDYKKYTIVLMESLKKK